MVDPEKSLDQSLRRWQYGGDDVMATISELTADVRRGLATLDSTSIEPAKPAGRSVVLGEWPKPQIDGYKIEDSGMVGHGGMGNVWKAWREKTGQVVALKTIRKLPKDLAAEAANAFARRQIEHELSLISRFTNELMIAARFEHAGMARIYDAGVQRDPAGGQSDVHFYAMEFVHGSRLNEYLAGRDADLSSLKLLEDICRIVAFIHERDVIHCDLKPSNIIVTPEGNPVIIDFGLAWDRNRKDAPDGGGTPAYMSPEQAAGLASAMDRRSDIYALGVILYEILTGPLDRRKDSASVEALIKHEAIAPRKLNPRVPVRLEMIVQKAMSRDRDKRYESAAQLADDLAAFRTSRPVRADPPGVLGRLRLQFTRPERITQGGAAVITLGSAFMIFTLMGILAVLFDLDTVHVVHPGLVLLSFVIQFALYAAVLALGLAMFRERRWPMWVALGLCLAAFSNLVMYAVNPALGEAPIGLVLLRPIVEFQEPRPVVMLYMVLVLFVAFSVASALAAVSFRKRVLRVRTVPAAAKS